MEILIWGTGVKGKLVKRMCDKKEWIVKAFIDNDETKWGSLEGISVISPDKIPMVETEDTQVWIATGDGDVYAQAKKLTRNVFAWEFVCSILRAQQERPEYPNIQLNSRNIRNCKLVRDRTEFLKQFAEESSGWKMAEVGVAFGDFSEEILKICLPQKLYCIDLWECERYSAGKVSVQNKLKCEIEAGRVEILQGTSIQKLNEFDDGELDWVYIDTVHDYETTKKELEICHKKVKAGGYICGHDYTKYNVYSRLDYGVFDAVNEFAVKTDYEIIYLTMEADGLQSFCLRKIVEAVLEIVE